MRTLSPDNELILFDGHLIRIIIHATGSLESSKAKISQRIEDKDGQDITDKARLHSITASMGKAWAELELNLPGYDGLFCVPQVELFSLL